MPGLTKIVMIGTSTMIKTTAMAMDIASSSSSSSSSRRRRRRFVQIIQQLVDVVGARVRRSLTTMMSSRTLTLWSTSVVDLVPLLTTRPHCGWRMMTRTSLSSARLQTRMGLTRIRARSAEQAEEAADQSRDR